MDDRQLLRYSRHILLPGMDYAGQQQLLDARVLLVGAGGLGCPVAMYLAASGVGSLTLVDDDRIDLANLQRQIAYRTADVGKRKTTVLAERLKKLNADVRVRALTSRLDDRQLGRELAGADLAIDASDNFPTRFQLNQACLAARVPLVYGAAAGADGQVAVFDSRDSNSPCYRCLYDDSGLAGAPTCAESGVLAPLTGIIGSAQALQAIKLLSGYGERASGTLWVFDARTFAWRQLKLDKDPNCPACGANAGADAH